MAKPREPIIPAEVHYDWKTRKWTGTPTAKMIALVRGEEARRDKARRDKAPAYHPPLVQPKPTPTKPKPAAVHPVYAAAAAAVSAPKPTGAARKKL